jgi:hypothetical protein
MEKLLEKISSYHLFNNLLPGAVFAFFVDSIGEIQLVREDVILNFFVFYFIGVIIGRIGSVVVEGIAKITHLVKYAEYSDFVKASDKDKKLQILLADNNMYRTFSALSLSMGLTALYKILLKNFVCLQKINVFILSVLLIVLFALAFRKQTKYISERVQIRLKDMQEGDTK